MTLQEQLERIDTDLKRNEERKRELQEKRKKVLGEIELENAKKAAEKNQKIVEVISESFGEVTEENLELFMRVMSEQSGNLQRRKEQLQREG